MMPDVPGSSSWAERGERRSGGGDDDGPARRFLRCSASFSGARAGSTAPAAVGTSSTGPGRAGAVRASTCTGSGRSVRACSTAGRATCAGAAAIRASSAAIRAAASGPAAVRASSAACRTAGAASVRACSAAVRAAASGAACSTRLLRSNTRRRLRLSRSTRPLRSSSHPLRRPLPSTHRPPSRSTHRVLRAPRRYATAPGHAPQYAPAPGQVAPAPQYAPAPGQQYAPAAGAAAVGAAAGAAAATPGGAPALAPAQSPAPAAPAPAAAPAQSPCRRAGEGPRPAGRHPRASDTSAHQGEPVGPRTRNHGPGLAASTGPGARGLPPRLAPAPRLRQRCLHGEGRASALRGGVLPGDRPPRPRLGLRGTKGRARSPLHLLVPHLRRRRRLGRVRDDHRAADEFTLVRQPGGRQLQPMCQEQLEYQDPGRSPDRRGGSSSAVCSSPGPRSRRTW